MFEDTFTRSFLLEYGERCRDAGGQAVVDRLNSEYYKTRFSFLLPDYIIDELEKDKLIPKRHSNLSQ